MAVFTYTATNDPNQTFDITICGRDYRIGLVWRGDEVYGDWYITITDIEADTPIITNELVQFGADLLKYANLGCILSYINEAACVAGRFDLDQGKFFLEEPDET